MADEWEYRVGDRVMLPVDEDGPRFGTVIAVRADCSDPNMSVRLDGDGRSPYFNDEVTPTTTTILCRELRDGKS